MLQKGNAMEKRNEAMIKVDVDCSDVDTAIKKAEHLKNLLLEAKTLVNELASKEITLHINL